MNIAGYNLFAPLLGNIKNWYSHIDRIKEMGFEWVYINPITYPGFSGSLYATKDYYKYNPAFFTSSKKDIAEKEIKDFTNYCKSKNIKLMIDLVINHSSKDCNLVEEHLEWYKLKDGKLVSPGAWDNGKWIEWGDLASFNNEKTILNQNNEEIENPIWNYWKKLIKHNLELGFSGFRCDAAYKVPKELWQYLINNAKNENNENNKNKEIIFFAESLGCSLEDTKDLIEAGFDYVASSAKWWDYESEWFIEQYDLARKNCKQIAFPSNHDTNRLITEYDGNIWKLKQTFLFTAMVCDMWMITLGDEYGFYKKCNVVFGNEKDYEKISFDLSEYIKDMNNYIKNNPILSNCGKIVSLDVLENIEKKKKLEELKKLKENNPSNNDENSQKEEVNEEIKEPFRKFYKYGLDEKEKVLIIVNITDKKEEFNAKKFGIKEDISFDNIICDIKEVIEILPYQLKVFKTEYN